MAVHRWHFKSPSISSGGPGDDFMTLQGYCFSIMVSRQCWVSFPSSPTDRLLRSLLQPTRALILVANVQQSACPILGPDRTLERDRRALKASLRSALTQPSPGWRVSKGVKDRKHNLTFPETLVLRSPSLSGPGKGSSILAAWHAASSLSSNELNESKTALKSIRTKVSTPGSKVSGPRAPPSAPAHGRGATLQSLQPLCAPFPAPRRFLQPGHPGPPGASRDGGPAGPATPVPPTRLRPLPLPPDRSLPSLRFPPQAAVPLRLHGPGRQPSDTRPREHGATGPAEGRSDRPQRAGAEASPRAPPAPLSPSVSLPPASREGSLASVGARPSEPPPPSG